MAEVAKQTKAYFQISNGYRRYVLGLLLVVAVFNDTDRYLLRILMPVIS